MKPKIIAAEIPALVTSNIPVKTPMIPLASYSFQAPLNKELPKLHMGIVAPAPAKSTSGSYSQAHLILHLLQPSLS